METSPYFSALVGLAGVAVGGVTSFATTWLTQMTVMREKRMLVEANKREKLFNEFVIEASRLYGDALTHGKDEIADLVKLYSLIGRMRLICSDKVIEAAEAAMNAIVDTYLAPNRNLRDLSELAKTGGLNPLANFDMVGREELRRFGSR